MAEEIYKHVCIKGGCGKQYEDTDPDPYYCPDCKEANKKIAEQVDKSIASRPRKKTMTGLEQYDAITKAKGARFPSMKDLGNIKI